MKRSIQILEAVGLTKFVPGAIARNLVLVTRQGC